MSREKKRIKSENCPNCHEPFSGNHQNYCNNCGQENHTHKLPVSHFVLELIESLTHFDTKFFQTFKDLVWKPGLVIKNYNDDKRARYLPPIRIYFFMSFIFFIILSYTYQSKVESQSETIGNALKKETEVAPENSNFKINNNDVASQYLALKNVHNLTLSQVDSVNKAQNKSMNWQDKRILISLIKVRNGELTFTEIYHRFIKYFSYALFILMPLFALLLQLFYHKRNYFYAEFLVFSIYFHTVIFGALSINLPLQKLFDFQNKPLNIILAVVLPVYLYFSLKRVFSNSFLKTLYKTALISLIYFICLVFIIFLLLIGSFV